MSEELERKSALIIGASRGLGLGLSLELLKRGWLVTATVRSAAGGTGLEDYYDHVTMDTLDINSVASIDPFVARMKASAFDVVFINAGVGGPEGMTAETAPMEEITHLFMTNTISPVRLAYKLVPMVKPGTGVLVFMSSVLGSVEANVNGFSSLYCASKAALNRLSRSFAAELSDPSITVINMHPGWVRTEMGGPNAPLDVATSVAGMANVLEAKAGTGGQHFLDYTGATLPW